MICGRGYPALLSPRDIVSLFLLTDDVVFEGVVVCIECAVNELVCMVDVLGTQVTTPGHYSSMGKMADRFLLFLDGESGLILQHDERLFVSPKQFQNGGSFKLVRVNAYILFIINDQSVVIAQLQVSSSTILYR